MYESTMGRLTSLFSKVPNGGYVIVDDYQAVLGCKKAVHDFMEEHYPDETLQLNEIDGTGVYWQRQL